MKQIPAVILAGGLARRLGGKPKGLQHWQGKPLISHIIERLSPQVCKIFLNVNRLQSEYARLFPDFMQYADRLANFQGPLSGMLSGFEEIQADYLLFVPCDSPLLPENLLKKLQTALAINHAQIAYAHDGERAYPTFALVHRSIVPALVDYLAQGKRRMLDFFASQKSVAVDFSEQAGAFYNFNVEADFTRAQNFAFFCKTPLLAITGYSGTGKTTLLEKLIPVLNRKGLRVGVIKHSHHHIEVDKAGKDSYRLRLAGANPTMIVCEQRWALMVETVSQPATFAQLVAQFDPLQLDLILVEGFKHERLPKIQLHRQGIPKPLPELDSYTLATATDYPLARENALNINQTEQIAQFILNYLEYRNQD